MKIKTRDVTVLAVAVALMFALTPIPVPIGLFLVPVLFVAILYGWKIGAVAGLLFGLVSLMYAFTIPLNFVAVAFQEAPWIAIVPRIFVGAFAALAFAGFRKLFRDENGKAKNRFSQVLPYSLAASVGVLTNTTLVVTSMVLAVPNAAHGDVTVLIGVPTMLIAGAIEFVSMNVIMPILCITVGRALKAGEFTPRKIMREREAMEKGIVAEAGIDCPNEESETEKETTQHDIGF